MVTGKSGNLHREGDKQLTDQIQIILKPNNLEIFTFSIARFTLERNYSLESKIIERME